MTMREEKRRVKKKESGRGKISQKQNKEEQHNCCNLKGSNRRPRSYLIYCVS